MNIEKVFLSRLITEVDPQSILSDMVSELFINKECRILFDHFKTNNDANRDLALQAAVNDKIDLTLAQEIIDYFDDVPGTEGSIGFWKSKIIDRYNNLVKEQSLKALNSDMEIEDIQSLLDAYKKKMITGKTSDEPTVLDLIRKCNDKSECYSSGFPKLDILLNGGLQRKRIYTVAARTGCGKTTFMLNLGINLARGGLKTVFASLEMPASEVASRLVSNISAGFVSTDFNERIKHVAEHEKFKSFLGRFHISEKGNSVNQIRKNFEDYDVIVIDQLSFMKTKEQENRALTVSKIIHEVKEYAVRHNKIIIIACQINRAGDSLTGGEPQLVHLKESGGVEEASDVCLLMHTNEDHVTCVNVAKNRAGSKGRAYMNVEWKWQRFSEVREYAEPMPNHQPYQFKDDDDTSLYR